MRTGGVGRLSRQGRRYRFGVLAGAVISALFPMGPAAADENPVADWAAIVQPSIHNPNEPRPPASAEVLHTIVHLAIYDAVVAIEGGYSPYGRAIPAPQGADVRAAVATAAYRAARGRVSSSQFAYLDDRYAAYLVQIPDGRAKAVGVRVGEAAAAGILARRATDGFNASVTYQCSAVPLPVAEFEPNGGCGTQPVDVAIGQVTPFTFERPAQFRPDGPELVPPDRKAGNFNEVKALGRKDSSVRTAEQTDIAYFWAEHGYVHWTRNLINLARTKNLSVVDTARLFAMAHTSASDAAIAGFEAKYFYRSWRPRTAIPRAAEDGNPATEPDPTWAPLLSVNHPEYPAAHGFLSTALTDGVAAFFGTDQVPWTIETDKAAVPQLGQTRRTYSTISAMMAEVANARVWAGLHFRTSMTEGAALGRRISQHVTTNYFRPRPADPAALPQLPRTGVASPTGTLATVALTLGAGGVATLGLTRRLRQKTRRR